MYDPAVVRSLRFTSISQKSILRTAGETQLNYGATRGSFSPFVEIAGSDRPGHQAASIVIQVSQTPTSKGIWYRDSNEVLAVSEQVVVNRIRWHPSESLLLGMAT